MSQAQKVGKNKNLAKSARHKAHNQAVRPMRVKRSRDRHLRNAKRCCGKKFAEQLKKYYAKNFPPLPKAGNHR